MTTTLGIAGAVGMHGDFPAVLPFDEHNQTLLENVHPPLWQEPTPKDRYHLVVIGAGTGGLVTAAAAAGLGATVALVERELMGGDCLNVGCVPSKAIIRAARAWRDARRAHAAFHGPRAAPDETGDFAAVMTRMRRLRAQLSPVDSAARFRELGVDVFLGNGRFLDASTVEVNGKQLRFRRAVIATGARAGVPPIPGLAESGYLTNETIFSLTARPKHLVVIGAGPIGCELSQAFALFGCEVTLIDRDQRILPNDDADAAGVVERALREDGVRLVLDAAITRVDGREGSTTVYYRRGVREDSVSGDALLIACGRAPNVEQLGLDAAGVKYDKEGVRVDDRLRTSNAKVYAAGDVCSPHKFTHAADFQARAVVQNALFFGRVKASTLVIPWATYTSPELAHVGLSEAQARKKGVAADTVTVPLHDVDRVLLDGAEEGFLRVVVAAGSDRILGATLVAEHAGDMISEVALAMTNGLGLSAIGRTIHPYPTQAEVFRKAADAWRRRKLTPFVKKVFALFFRMVR